VRRHEGGSFPAWAVLTAVRDATGTLAHYIFSCLDISDRKASEEQVKYLAHHDVLTGLPNRVVAEQKLREAMERAQTTGREIAILFIDLDRFKTINDSLGHQTGDALLKVVAERLSGSIREADTVSRFGGDEFVVLLDGVSGSSEALQIAQRLLVSLREPYLVETLELNVSCSVGIAMFPGDAADMDELMRHADAAMYEAKASGRDGVYFFTRELNDRAQQRLQVELLLRNAVARDEMRLVFQPQVNAVDGSLTAVEALLRWASPELGDVTPAVFIPLAEESRLIVPIGEWVIDEACRQLADWRARGIEVGMMSVNLSAVQLLDAGLVSALRGSLARHAVPARLIELELTESTLMESTDERLRQLHALKSVGVQLSIDDFGTGYSSLSYLSRLPMDKLKIDRSLVKDILTEPKDRAITEAIIALAHRLKMMVVAEGVESADVHAALAEAWCDGIQGYHTGRPMAPEALERWIKARSTSEKQGQLSRF
jgi:diguanylate cyclase (GGDEF)-like protein